MKYFLITFFCILITLPANAYTIKGNITYTVDSAREKAFENVEPQIDISKYKDYFVDKNYVENMKAIAKNKFNLKDRKLCYFSSTFYGVQYKKSPYITLFYNNKGQLDNIQFEVETNFPKKTIAYDQKGYLGTIIFSVTPNNSFIFDTNKQLIIHWINNNGYNENNELIKTRKY